MNNDINNNINFISAQKANSNAVQKMPTQQKEDNNNTKENMQSSLNFLGTLGCAQVNMNNLRDKGIRQALEKLKSDPIFVETHTQLCDKLVQEGYPLEKAILTSDKILETLADKNTYI